MRLALTAKAASGDALRALTELRRYADDDLKKKLEPVDGVAAVKVGGGLEDEIQVDIDQQKLAQLNLPIDTVIAAPEAGKHQRLRRPPGGGHAALTSCAR